MIATRSIDTQADAGTEPKARTPARPATMLEGAALVTLVAGYGGIGGNFSQPDSPLGLQYLITAIHLIPVVLFAVAGTRLLVLGSTRPRRLAVSILCGLAAVGLAIVIGLGVSNPDPNSFGPHNFADYFPVAMVVGGLLVWVASLLRSRPPM